MRKRKEPYVSPVRADIPISSHRSINYLRLSVTDRCNLRCVYCMPEEVSSFLPRNDILSYEELLYIVNLFVVKGIRKVRLTGGEPLVRNGIIPLDGPALRYALEGADGEIGLIGAMSRPFCSSCNRIRLTADGRLKGCLFSNQETDIKTPLRSGRGDDCLLRLIQDTIANKPEKHGLDIHHPVECVRSMNSIGG